MQKQVNINASKTTLFKMSKSKKIIFFSIGVLLLVFYWLINITENKKLFKSYSPYGEYSIYVSKYKYEKYLPKIPNAGYGSGKIYLFDEVNQKVISSCGLSSISDIENFQWDDEYVRDRAEHWLKLPRPLVKNNTPKGYKIITELEGNLNTDIAYEKVVVYNTTDTTDYGVVRELQILKKNKGKWELWKTSRNALLASKDGGMSGDPFGSIEIENGILLINQNGGSSWKWDYTDKYRFQNNEFELIGISGVYGKLCEYWVDIDFNLSTGKIIYIKEF